MRNSPQKWDRQSLNQRRPDNHSSPRTRCGGNVSLGPHLWERARQTGPRLGMVCGTLAGSRHDLHQATPTPVRSESSSSSFSFMLNVCCGHSWATVLSIHLLRESRRERDCPPQKKLDFHETSLNRPLFSITRPQSAVVRPIASAFSSE
jgi:hypothetical protein